MSKSAVNQSRAENKANLWNLLEKCRGWDLNWLFYGQDPLAAVSAELRAKGLRMILEPLPAAQPPLSPPGEGSH